MCFAAVTPVPSTGPAGVGLKGGEYLRYQEHHPGMCAQSCLTLCDPVDCSPLDFSVHGILQARTQEWVAISFSKKHLE